jgi:hypothetical protein
MSQLSRCKKPWCSHSVFAIPFERKPVISLVFETMVSNRSHVFVIIGAMLSVSAIAVSIVCVVIIQKKKSTERKKAALHV